MATLLHKDQHRTAAEFSTPAVQTRGTGATALVDRGRLTLPQVLHHRTLSVRSANICARRVDRTHCDCEKQTAVVTRSSSSDWFIVRTVASGTAFTCQFERSRAVSPERVEATAGAKRSERGHHVGLSVGRALSARSPKRAGRSCGGQGLFPLSLRPGAAAGESAHAT